MNRLLPPLLKKELILKDNLVRVVTRESNIRGIACVTTNMVNKACTLHDAYPTAAAALGRALTAGALMGSLLKSRQRVALKFEGNGPLKKILIEADEKGGVRGYVGDPHVDVPLKNGMPDVAAALGKAGFLTVTKDLFMKEPYQGIVRLYTSEIAEDLAYYLTESEQIPSAVGIGVYLDPKIGVTAAGGFLIQTLPPSDEKIIDRLMKRLKGLPLVTSLVREGKGPNEILKMIFGKMEIDTLAQTSLRLECSCSRTRIESALITLGKKEIDSLIEDEKPTTITCEFCKKAFNFSKEELTKLSNDLEGSPA